MTQRFVIIGAGQAGIQAAASLRQEGFGGHIVMIGAEPLPPYQRPPLSKAYLEGGLDEDRLYLKPPGFFEKEKIELKLGVKASCIDRARKTLLLESGEALAYDALLIATGASARRLELPGAELAGIHVLRSLSDCDGLRPWLQRGERLLIVGAGYIGLEVAAVARKAGIEAVVVESASRALQRVACPEVSHYFAALHGGHGVDLKFDAVVVGFEGRSSVESALLANGERIACDAVLVAVGATPATELAAAAGLAIDNGVRVDETARTDDPAIWAAGDCANFPSLLYGRRMRLESVPNAIELAKIAAANMAGRRLAYDATPWFWSDQYGVKLQTAGLAEDADETVIRGDLEGGPCSVWRLKAGRLLAVDSMNDVAAFAVGKRLIAARATPDTKILADTRQDLKSLLI